MLSRLFLSGAILTIGFTMLPLVGCADHDRMGYNDRDRNMRYDDRAANNGDYNANDHSNADRDSRRSDVHVDNRDVEDRR